MRNAGINVHCPQCDIADLTVVKEMITECADMPPIGGCFQASMVLQVSLSIIGGRHDVNLPTGCNPVKYDAFSMESDLIT